MRRNGDVGPRRLRWAFLGTVRYGRAVELQHRLRDEIRAGDGDECLLLLEHPHVYTLGRNARREDLLASDRQLAELGVEVAECNRGGQVTYHGPGQLVGYPLLNLDPDRRDVRRYVRDLQEVLVRTLRHYGIRGEARREQPVIGVWVGRRKIASIGVHISRWLTSHGFALNVTTDLRYFGGVVACGLPEVQMASIESLTGRKPATAEVAEVCAACFAEVFGRELRALPAQGVLPAWATAS